MLDGIRKFVTDVSDLNVDLIDRINPFGEAYSILAKSMSEDNLKQIHSIVSSKKTSMDIQEARELVKRSIQSKRNEETTFIKFIRSLGKRMAEGIAFCNGRAGEIDE